MEILEMWILIAFILVIIISLIFHELAHMMVLSHYNKGEPVKIRWVKWRGFEVGEKRQYEKLNKKQLFDVYFYGFVAGIIPYWYFAERYNAVIGTMAVAAYFFSFLMSSDFKNIMKLMRKDAH